MLYFFIISVALVGLMLSIRKPMVSKVLSGLFVANLVALLIRAYASKGQSELTYFTFDGTATIMLSLLVVVAIPAYIHSFYYLIHESDRGIPLYISGLTGLLTSLVGVYLSNNLIVLWVFMEATTLTVSVLIYHHRSTHALEATWKYVFVSSIGIALAYMGILFLGTIVSHSGDIPLSYKSLEVLAVSANPAYLRIAFLFVLVGFSTKMELFPMHTVGIDANTIAPPPISAVMSTLMVNSGFVAIYRLLSILDGTIVGQWACNVLILSGILSVVIAATYLLKSNNLKRLLAYSTLENMGLVAIALGIGGVARYAAFVHIIAHTFLKSALFFQVRQVRNTFDTYEISKMGGYIKHYSAGALVLMLGTLGIVAFPPSGLFVSELAIFKTMLVQQRWVLFVVLVLVLLFCVYAIVQKLFSILYAKESVKPTGFKLSIHLTVVQYALVGLAFYVFFFKDGFVMNLINEAIK
jgi:hydrogenase-4 component F